MPIKHIVLLPFKSSLLKDQIEQVKFSMLSLKEIIPQIKSFFWIENNSPENLHHGYLHGFVMEFDSVKDREIYLNNAQHIKIAQEIVLPALEDGTNSPIVFDYTI